MARRIRTRLPWPRGRLAAGAADASFFEDDAKRWPRPDSPEVSVFSPAEEEESHKRWNRAMLRERFTGPVSGAEARHNKPRVGRIVMARGRDATDVAISTTFGPCTLAGFRVVTDEVGAEAQAQAARRGDAAGLVPDRSSGQGSAQRDMAVG